MNRAAVAARVLALIIAIVAVIDPAVPRTRATKAEIALIAPHHIDSALARRIAERLDDDFTIIDGPWDRAAASVIVGNSLPEAIPTGRVFAVRDHDQRRVTSFRVPPTTHSTARTTIPMGWHSSMANTVAELRANAIVVDRDSSRGAEFEFIPASTGPMVLEGRLVDGASSTSVHALTNVIDRPHAVLFFDRRPSWMSTFVRRSLEEDRRFAVASRIVTSRGVSTDAGQPPSTLADPAILDLYDVIVIGAPGALTPADVAGIESFLKRRGGTVLLLYDEVPTSGAHSRLTGATRWTPTTLRTPGTAGVWGDSMAARFTEVAWPASIPRNARVHVSARIADIDRPVLWSVGFGSGQVLVSGALDAWKFRDQSTSGFTEFWRATISIAAREAGEAVTVQLSPSIVEPGERVRVRVSSRDTTANLTDARFDSAAIRLWPGERAGEFTGELRAPATGDHWTRVTVGANRGEAPLAVREVVQRVPEHGWASLELLTRTNGGAAGTIDSVERAIRASVRGEERNEPWWPMRSGWWIVPFVLLLGFEWFVRRRQGLA